MPPGDGSNGLIVSNFADLKRLDALGNVVQVYDAPGEDSWFAMNLDPNGRSFWSAGLSTGNFYRFNITTGLLEVGPINAGGALSGICVEGEIIPGVCDNNRPSRFAAPVCGSEQTVPAGSNVTIPVSASDPDAGDVVTLTALGNPPGAAFLAVPGNPATGTFSWTPAAADQGDHVVVFQATDQQFCHAESCSVTIHVITNEPPDCSHALPSIAELWPPNHQMVNVDIVGVTDPDGDPVTITITGITQDEPVNGLGDGNTGPDGADVGTSTAQLRAERAGTPKVPGNGRVYVISFSAADGRGGECRGRVPVCVPHDQGRGHVCIDDGQNFDSTVGGAPLRRVGSGSDNALGVDLSPNPFNPATTIHYVIPVTSRVGVMVYDTSGRVVRVLVDAVQSAGNQSVQWDGRDDLGRAVPSGIYLCRLHAGEVKETKRMLLLK